MSKDAAETALDELEEKWGRKAVSGGAPVVATQMGESVSVLPLSGEYPQSHLHHTNAIESVHRQFRKLTKTKGAFPNENSLLKLLYLGLMNAQEKWTMPVRLEFDIACAVGDLF